MYTTEETMEIAGKLVGNYGRYLNHEDREDLKQEITFAMWKAGQDADENQNVRAYQFTTGKGIALNISKRIAKHNKRFKTTLNVDVSQDEEDLEEVDLIPAPDTDCDAAILESERTSAIENAIASLPTVQASAINRILREGATLEVFGRENGFTKEWARQILNDAKAILALRLRAWEPTAC